MLRTVRWARQAAGHHARRLAEIETRHALFPIVQGSTFADLRRECATELADLDADGYAIGGLSVGEPRPLSMQMVEASVAELPRRVRATRWGGDAGGAGGIRGARGGHDGLRTAQPQCAQRIPVHQRRTGGDQTRAV